MKRSIQHKVDLDDKGYAMSRLEHMRDSAVRDYDQEAIDHADEIVRIVSQIPAIYFRGFGDFRGPK